MRARVMGLDAVCQMVEAGVGIAIVPDTAARRAMASLNIARIAVRDSWASRRLVVCAKSFKGLSKPARELAEHLQQFANGRTT